MMAATQSPLYDAQGRRKATRSTVAFEAQLRLADLSKIKLYVVEISTHGFRAMTPSKLHVGESVYLHVPTLSALHATVRWTNGNACGCEFVQPLYGPVAEHIARQYPGHFQVDT